MFTKCPTVSTPSGIQQQKSLKMSMCSAVNAPLVKHRSGVSSAVFLKSAIWPQYSVINIEFLNGADWQKAWVEKVVTEKLSPLINLQLVFNAYPAQITISFDSQGASSLIGSQSPLQRPSMYLGWTDYPDKFEWKGISYTPSANAPGTLGASSGSIQRGMHRNNGFTTGATVIHEFGHALGMLHEHQNPRGTPIEWNKEAVWNAYCGPPNNWDWQAISGNVLDSLTLDSTNGSSFDPDSIMIYQFSPQLTLNMKNGTHMNAELSTLDKQWLQKTYPTTTTSTTDTSTTSTTTDTSTTDTTGSSLYGCVNGICSASDTGTFSTIDDCYKSCGTFIYPTIQCKECGVSIDVEPICQNQLGETIVGCGTKPTLKTIQCDACVSSSYNMIWVGITTMILLFLIVSLLRNYKLK